MIIGTGTSILYQSAPMVDVENLREETIKALQQSSAIFWPKTWHVYHL